MKRLLLVLVVLCLLVVGANATSSSMQRSASDWGSVITCLSPGGVGGNATCQFYKFSTGNNYVKITGGGNSGGVILANPIQTSYAAATMSKGSYVNTPLMQAYDANMNKLGTYIQGNENPSPSRYEFVVSSGTACGYKNGFLLSCIAMPVNPHYVAFWGEPVDDYVYGDTENRYIFGNPEYGSFVLIKDTVNPSANGFVFSNNNTIVSSINMTTTWGRSNISYAGNQTIVLENVDTGTIYGTRYTGTYAAGTVSWALNDEIFNSGAPYGRYYVTIPGTGAYSEEIWYLGSGATISFDKSTYSGQDTATMTYSVLGDCWDTSTYSYTIDVVSGTTGATMQSTAISSSSGTEDYTFAATDPLGVYYAIVKATKHSDGSVIWMNYDYAELSSYVTIEGYINDAETGLPINNAHINITQNSIINNLTTIADGNYSATYYLSGSPITINATASLHRQYTYTFTPLIAKTISINISLANLTPNVSGLGIGGIARETAYGRPLSGVTVWLINTTNAQSYTKTTSDTGWYLCDEGTTCFLATKRPYDVWGEKAGYSNSANYTVVMP